MDTLLLATVLFGSLTAADAVPPLLDRFDVVDNAFFSMYSHDRKFGEVHDSQNKGTFISEVTVVRPTGPNKVGVSKTREQRVYSAKDGLMESVACVTENPNSRVDGHREGPDIVLNIKMQNAVTQYRLPAPSIDDEQVPRRLGVAKILGSKLDFAEMNCFTGKAEPRHAVLQTKALRRVDGATITVYKVVVTGAKPADNTIFWVDGRGNNVEVRLKGGMVVFQREANPAANQPKNPFTANDGTP